VFYIVESSKSFYEATFDLGPVIQRLGFVILHVHDISETLRRREIGLDDECQLFDICNYRQIEKLLAIDMQMSLTLPWRISVFTENGATKLGVMRPATLLGSFSTNPEVLRIAREIEEKMIQIIDETR
jgi:uncharacterized protein (DUF302 family)